MDDVTDLVVELAEIDRAINPVVDWYADPEFAPRTRVEIIRDIVADLQQDRKENIRLRHEMKTRGAVVAPNNSTDARDFLTHGSVVKAR